MADAKKGAEVLDAEIAKTPVVVPIRERMERLMELHARGMPKGDLTGWPSVDELYTVAPGQLTIVTGWPGSGKSEWIDALLVNLSHQGWRLAIFSPENHPIEVHQSKVLEKLIGKPFGAGPSERIFKEEIAEHSGYMDEHFGFMEAPEGAVSVHSVLHGSQAFLAPSKKRGLVIDPWNELEHWRPPHLNETEYISRALSMIRHWARRNRVHVWLCAHPQKVRRNDDGKLPIPRPDMISGSQNWWNKADACVTVYRDFHENTELVEIHVQKIRFKHVGRIGVATLRYDLTTGRYFEMPRSIAPVPRDPWSKQTAVPI